MTRLLHDVAGWPQCATYPLTLQDAKEVHLDDNLRRANLSAPLMVTPASQRQLELALWGDTAFLSGLAIMDYSLLVSSAGCGCNVSFSAAYAVHHPCAMCLSNTLFT